MYYLYVTVKSEIKTKELADLVKQVQAGNEVLLTQGDKPMARLIPAREAKTGNGGAPLRIRIFTTNEVLTPIITQAEIAEDLFGEE